MATTPTVWAMNQETCQSRGRSLIYRVGVTSVRPTQGRAQTYHVGDHKIIWYLYTLVLHEYKVRSIGDRIWQANRVKRREHHRPAFFISFGLFREKVMLWRLLKPHGGCFLERGIRAFQITNECDQVRRKDRGAGETCAQASLESGLQTLTKHNACRRSHGWMNQCPVKVSYESRQRKLDIVAMAYFGPIPQPTRHPVALNVFPCHEK
jgi:hypothetical protein